ncbi:hypothetical protein B0T26DRAFT_682967 [Lasiosphaeria miniovina]|uniref:Protein kinase domain-containing protein n=1 Tax=Lasiosphaeria miniovina TaxID=1954250 RepID=A0AA40BF64_9PEZI|nr:uncharacterized protein B0T26DRAFT_682967 [Lasiosphaeria miniovina]KAK0733141.1 hypothetical protein B0T26DRAFT_682967 [Lasiosphaeria miniovina]
MVSPLSLTVDLNEIVKKVLDKVKDARDFERDSSNVATDFLRELSRTDSYDKLIKHQSFIDAASDLQRAILADAVQDVYCGWHELYTFIDQPHSLASAATWTVTLGNGEPKGVGSAPRREGSFRGIYWAWKGKSRTKGLLDRVRLSNEYLRVSVNEVLRYREINRLAIQHGTTSSNMNILRDSAFVETQQDAIFGPASSLRRALASGSTPVLVEYLPSEDFFPQSVDRAVRLAMLLNQPPAEGFGVLPCIGLCQNKDARRFEFMFDLASPLADMQQHAVTGTKALVDAFLGGFHSLRSQLSRLDRNAQPGILRHYKSHEARFHKPVSVGQRLALAAGLAKTVQHLHQADWVHGNINSSNIYFFHSLQESQPGSSSRGLPTVRPKTPYLFGFQFTRLTDEYSDQWMWMQLPSIDNLHRHPDRQILQNNNGNNSSNDRNRNSHPKKPHAPHHDIYSLGVVLLEIGLGRPADELVKLAPHMAGDDIQRVASQMTDELSATKMAKHVFTALAETALPGTMGDAYANIARICLGGDVQNLDTGSSGDGDAAAGQEDVSLANAFRLRVVEPLDRMLSVLS